MRKSCKFIVLATLLIVVIALFGCTTARKNNTGLTGTRYNSGNTGRNPNGLMNRLRTGQNEGNLNNQLTGDTNNNNFALNNMNARASRIKTELDRMPGLNDVEVLISGDHAIVGCDSTNNLGSLRRTIEQRVKRIDPTITKVTVSNSKDIMNEMRTMNGNITNGVTSGNFNNRFQQLLNRITP